MATANFVLLEKISVGAAGASSVTFSNIPQTGYTDLVLKMSTRTTENPGASALGIQFNGASTSVTAIRLGGNGSAASSSSFASSSGGFGRFNNATGESADKTANTFSNNEMYFPNYTSSNFKSFSNDGVEENNATLAYSEFDAGLWSSTSAITSIGLNVYGGGGSFAQGSTFYLYGVAKLGTTPAIQPYATGGDTIMTDGTYWYHAFKSSGTFTPAKGLSCDVLVVAGGGSGRGDVGGGGGAGGLLYSATQSLTTTGYTVTIGAGGAVGATAGSNGNAGSNSSFASLTATGGGGGSSTTGGSGGSGGGGGATGGTGTSGQGNNGGTGASSGFYGQGGGGGASAAGGNGTTTAGGAGGNGSSSYSSWGSATGTGQLVSSTYYFAGGGGGSGDFRQTNTGSGAGGYGGGGAGSPNGSSAGVSATANTGGGGGGGGYGAPAQFAGAGGSGLVIVRYAV